RRTMVGGSGSLSLGPVAGLPTSAGTTDCSGRRTSGCCPLVIITGFPSPRHRNVADSSSPLDSSAPGPGGSPRVISERYEVLRVLGEGASARTLLCSDLRENRRVAIKELHLARLGD